MSNGIGAIAGLQGKVNAQNQLAVAGTLSLVRSESAHLDGSTAYTAALMIPPPLGTERLVITGITVSALSAAVFRVSFTSGWNHYGPVWLSAPGAGIRGQVWSSGAIMRRLPAGSGLTVTTSADVPQSIDVEYHVEPAEV